MKNKLPLVSIIVVNYNGKRYLKTCFGSLFELNYPKTKLEIIMVDNCSSDDSIKYIKKYFPKVEIVRNDVNNYCRANNLGINRATGEYIALVNNDTKADKNWLVELIRVINQDNTIGAVGSKILFMDGLIQSVGHQEHPNFYWVDKGFQEQDRGQHDQAGEVFSICGCSVLYRNKCLKDVGLFDEDFNYYLEDIDMSLRCRKKDWRLLICPSSIIYHKLHGTVIDETRARLQQEKNRLLLVAKHWPDKLSSAIIGQEYFTKHLDYEKEKDICNIISFVYAKLMTTHSIEVINKISPGIFNTLRKIFNSERDFFIQDLNARQRQLTESRQELEKIIASFDKKRAELDVANQLLKESEQTNSRQEEQIDHLQQEIEIKDKQLIESRQKLEKVIAQQQTKLQEIYSSTGFKYLLRPLWSLLWFIKQNLKKLHKVLFGFSQWSRRIFKFFLRLRLIRFDNFFLRIKNIIRLSANKNKWAKAYLSHIYRNTIPPFPERMSLMLTTRCNMNCQFCDIPARDYKNKELSKEEASKTIDSVARLGIKEIVVTGGEPLLHPYLFDIVDFANSRNINVVLSTNGILIKRNIERILQSRFSCICISIDGTEATHDTLRNYGGAYKCAIGAINLLRKYSVSSLVVNFVATNKNVHELEDVYNYFSAQNIKLVFLPVINKPELFISKPNERRIYFGFIKKLYRKGDILSHEYNYLKRAVSTYFVKKHINVRCLGLSFEFGIDSDGNVTPCCIWENRKAELNNLGNIFTDDLEELWFSSKFHKARLSIFKEGCQNCFNPSLYEFTRRISLNYLIRKNRANIKNNSLQKHLSADMSEPSHIHFRFTSRCNLSCRHCDIWKNIEKYDYTKELSVYEWQQCIDKLSNWLGRFRLDLAGGEVLLYKDAINLINYCADKDIRVSLTTNATLIDGEVAKKLAYSRLYNINLSLDGLAQAHEYIRNQKGTYDKVKQAAFNLRNYRRDNKPYITISTVITKYNLDQLDSIVELVDKWNIDGISFQALDHNFGAGYYDDWFRNNEFWPENDHKLEIVMNSLTHRKKSGINICNSFEQLNDIKDYYKNPAEAKKYNKCKSGDINFIVDEFGGARLCWNMSPIGNILIQNPKEIWHSELASQQRKEIDGCRRTCRILNCNYEW